MKHKPVFAAGAAISAIGLAVGSAAPASAQPIVHEHFSESRTVIEQEVFPEFCAGIVDFPVLHSWDTRGNFLLVQRGDGLPYALATFQRTDDYTNTLNGKTFHQTMVATEKDQRIIDNGDGTFTIIFSASGVQKSYGPDGTRLFMDSGIFKGEVLIDNGGTPSDPNDDQFLEFVRVITDTGRSDTENRDFCTDLADFIG
ncbi:hypothetical protein [Arthrobacter cupressi]